MSEPFYTRSDFPTSYLISPFPRPPPHDNFRYTGKLGGQQDDTVIALQLALIAQRTFFEDARYSQFSKQPI
jgi:hypothetical protein